MSKSTQVFYNGQPVSPGNPLPVRLTGGASNSFESVSKNLSANDASFVYTGDQLTSIVYTTSGGTITKTLSYSGSQLNTITLSGDTPIGIDLIKTLSYTGGSLTSIAYS